MHFFGEEVKYTVTGNTVNSDTATITIETESTIEVIRKVFITLSAEIEGEDESGEVTNYTITDDVELKFVLVPQITIGEPVLEYQDMPLNVVQIITVPVTTEDIQENVELDVRLVQAGIDLPESYYTVSEQTTDGNGIANMKIFAGPEITVGKYLIVIEYTYGEYGEKVQAQKEVTISNIEMNQIIINPSSIVAEVGERTRVTYTIVPSIFTKDDVKFVSENETVATFTDDGVITAVGRGETNVKIMSLDGRVQGICLVTVFKPTIDILEITTTPEVLKQGEDGKVNIKLSTNDFLGGESLDIQIYKAEQDVTENFIITGNEVQTNETDIEITINKDIITSGEYEVSIFYDNRAVSSENFQKIKTKFTIIGDIPVEDLEGEEGKIYLTENAERQIQAKILPENATNKKLIWTSSNPQVAVVDENGLVKTLTKGITQITVYADENPDLTKTVEVRVIDIIGTEEYTLDLENKVVKHIPLNTTQDSLIENIQIASDNYSLLNQNDEIFAKDKLVGTGCQLKVNEEKFKLIVNGDINGDGKLTVTDISKLVLHIVELQTLEGNPVLGADMNKDGKISTTDISQMKKYILQIYE